MLSGPEQKYKAFIDKHFDGTFPAFQTFKFARAIYRRATEQNWLGDFEAYCKKQLATTGTKNNNETIIQRLNEVLSFFKSFPQYESLIPLVFRMCVHTNDDVPCVFKTKKDVQKLLALKVSMKGTKTFKLAEKAEDRIKAKASLVIKKSASKKAKAAPKKAVVLEKVKECSLLEDMHNSVNFTLRQVNAADVDQELVDDTLMKYVQFAAQEEIQLTDFDDVNRPLVTYGLYQGVRKNLCKRLAVAHKAQIEDNPLLDELTDSVELSVANAICVDANSLTGMNVAAIHQLGDLVKTSSQAELITLTKTVMDDIGSVDFDLVDAQTLAILRRTHAGLSKAAGVLWSSPLRKEVATGHPVIGAAATQEAADACKGVVLCDNVMTALKACLDIAIAPDVVVFSRTIFNCFDTSAIEAAGFDLGEQFNSLKDQNATFGELAAPFSSFEAVEQLLQAPSVFTTVLLAELADLLAAVEPQPKHGRAYVQRALNFILATMPMAAAVESTSGIDARDSKSWMDCWRY